MKTSLFFCVAVILLAACSQEPAAQSKKDTPAPETSRPSRAEDQPENARQVRIPVAEFTTPAIAAPVPADRTIVRKDGTLEVPVGVPVRVEYRHESESSGSVVNQKETATGKGSSVDARGEKLDASLKSDAPSARLGAGGVDADGNATSEGGGATGAASSTSLKIVGQTPRQWATYGLAALCVLVGAAFCYFQSYRAGIAAIAAGVLFFAMGVVAETYPLVYVAILVGAVLSLVALAVYAVLTLKNKNDQSFALNRLVDSVDTHIKKTGDRRILDAISYEAADTAGGTDRFDGIVDRHREALGILPPKRDPFITPPPAPLPPAAAPAPRP